MTQAIIHTAKITTFLETSILDAKTNCKIRNILVVIFFYFIFTDSDNEKKLKILMTQ